MGNKKPWYVYVGKFINMSNMYDLGRFTAAGQEMFGDQCYKKCSLLSPQYPYRVREPGSPMLGLF